MSIPPDQSLTELQTLADTVVARSPQLAGLNDQGVVDYLIAPYFRSLGPPAVVRHLIDVGAAYGSVALVFLRDGWTADLLEPDPECRRNLAPILAGFPGTCRVFPLAAGAEDRESVLFQQNMTPGLSGFDASPFGAPRNVIPVQSARLETFLNSQGVGRVDFLKIDTEGRDFEVLETHDFARFPPTLLLVEYSYYFPRQRPADVTACISAMERRGYSPLIFEYDDDGNFQRGDWTHRLIAIHLDASRVPTRATSFGNILFYRKDDLHLIEGLARLLRAAPVTTQPLLKQAQGVIRLLAADSPSHQAEARTRLALATQRRELARHFLSLPVEDLEAAYVGAPGDAHRMLRASLTRNTALNEADLDSINLVRRDLANTDSAMSQIPLLLAAMLYLEPHEIPRIFPFEAVPPWLQEEYAKYMLTPPNFFRDLGEAEAFGRHMQRWVAYLHRGILGHPRDQLWVNIRNYALQALNFMFMYFNDLNLREMYRQRAEIFEFTLRSSGHRLDYVFPPRMDRPLLRLGILAAHYSAQTETFTTLPLYDYLDRRAFEIILITTEANHSPLERYCISRADRFIPLPVVPLPQGLPAQVQAIRDADLDFLIVGTNVTARTNPIALLAMHRLARIQIMHVSSCTTSGMSHMDYYLSGRLTERAEEAQDQYTERLLLIDGPAHCYDFATEQLPVPARTLTREQFGIPADATVFISGANCLKIIPELRDVWIRILRQTPGSWLLLYPFNPYWMSSYPVETLLQGFRAAAAAQGISDDRILVFAPAPNRAEVLERLRLADIYLDSFPFSGANSLLDPLEVGLPSVVMDGSTFRELMGAAMLRELQLEELVGSSPENYVELACRLASNATYRSQIRDQLQAAMQSKPKFLDPRWYAAQVAGILSAVWAERSAVNFAPLTRVD